MAAVPVLTPVEVPRAEPPVAAAPVVLPRDELVLAADVPVPDEVPPTDVIALPLRV